MLNPHRLVNIGLAFTIAATLATAYMLDGPTLAQTEADVAADVAAAQADARRAAKSCCPSITNCLPAHVRARTVQCIEVAAK